jgi:hypothetical protein
MKQWLLKRLLWWLFDVSRLLKSWAEKLERHLGYDDASC